MKLRKKLRLILIAAAIFAAGCAVFYLTRPLAAQMQMTSLLRDAGFKQARIDATARIPGGFSFTGISLDNNKFSTIEHITLEPGQNGRHMTVDKLVLTGDWQNLAAPDIAGWSAQARLLPLLAGLKKSGIDVITLGGGQLDVNVPLASLIRLEAKGQVTLLPDGAARLQGLLWSVQQKMKAQLSVNGEFAVNGVASLDVEVTEGKMDMAALTASRMGGWIILNRDTLGAPWNISGQIMAGAASLYGLPLSNLVISAQGTTQDAGVTVQAGGSDAAASQSPLSIDAQLRRAGEDSLSLTLRSEQFGAGRPGGVLVYDTRAPRVAEMLKTGNINLADLAGNVWLRGVLQPATQGKGVDIDIRDVKLQPLADALGLTGLRIDGTLTGILPLVKNDRQHLAVDQGLLRSAESGTIALDGNLPAAIQSTREDTARIFKSFLYEKIELSLSGDTQSAFSGDIAITGKPDAEKDAKTTLVTLHFNTPHPESVPNR
ncbi:MAG: YdbH domain-containing protein [Micavibrio aeruginosavorus]|nr:YdbH domain-containing protein [Micavibrio aeruginosavorus]